ncbi:hypothetical protein E2C01_042829 [Portunus trituberculatus]|uniref:Secreted protein n=1 Tax=Portunus trituberculatus TaxID=210409 RepID=A0A5B7FMT5_PORTR|nr:hypothetical protein [Portunus trituberculatus]
MVNNLLTFIVTTIIAYHSISSSPLPQQAVPTTVDWAKPSRLLINLRSLPLARVEQSWTLLPISCSPEY